MAKHSRRRKSVTLIKANIDAAIALATLADNTGILVATDTVVSRAFILSVEGMYSIEAQTSGEGPITLYLAHSDYTLAEIEEYIELQTGWDGGDMVSKEISRRKIRQVGYFSGQLVSETINDGRPKKTALKFVLNPAQGLNLCVYNNSGGALAGGATVRLQGHAWIKVL